ncbi:MAG: cryptochrome/photolyase family protein [Gammaproteobacteria bacterium]|nr:cryptochrome/photolyase family protein [Gammaproteobacteria bacterium]
MTDTVLILGDQLSFNLSSLAGRDPANTQIIMAEVGDEASYVPHHPKKIALIFAAMRHFAKALRELGYVVHYFEYGQAQDLLSACQQVAPLNTIHVTEPGEYRLRALFDQAGLQLHADTRFVCSHQAFRDWASGRKQLRMELFYRIMRKQTGLLMDNGEPIGGKWNFDADNRKAYKGEATSGPLRHTPNADTQAVIALVRSEFATHFGSLEDFWFAVTHEQAEASLAHFIEHHLPQFGDYQDAMRQDDDFLFHSALSQYINIGLLDPLSVCKQVEAANQAGKVPLNAAEGFIRQIIGWREFVRGIYWLNPKAYIAMNGLEAERSLPAFFWDERKTQMNCLRQAVRITREQATAHHILRLMVIGNFSLLAGLNPQAVSRWYLSVYADAFEWVEAPNVIGMVLHADGGYLGSKPYCASGQYINKQGDYCKHCRYSVKESTGEKACPFNALYWHFLQRHREQFAGNPRMALVYKAWDRMADTKQQALLAWGDHLLANIEQL